MSNGGFIFFWAIYMVLVTHLFAWIFGVAFDWDLGSPLFTIPLFFGAGAFTALITRAQVRRTASLYDIPDTWDECATC